MQPLSPIQNRTQTSNFMARLRAGVLIACSLLAGCSEMHDDIPKYPQAYDAQRKLLFIANGNGAVRVITLRSGMAEARSLRTPARHQIKDIQLDETQHWLWVLGDDAAYRYNAFSLAQTGRFTLSNPMATRFTQVSSESFTLEPTIEQTITTNTSAVSADQDNQFQHRLTAR